MKLHYKATWCLQSKNQVLYKLNYCKSITVVPNAYGIMSCKYDILLYKRYVAIHSDAYTQI